MIFFFFFNFLQNLQCFPSQTLCSGKQAFVWNSPLGGHGVQRDSGTVEQTLKAPQLGLNSWEVALLFSKSSPSGWLRQGNQLGSCRGCSVVGLGRGSGAAAELLPGAVTSQPWRDVPSGRVLVWLQGIPGNVSTRSGKVPVPPAEATALSGFNKE